MIDKDGYRPNVGIVLCNRHNQVLWARRYGRGGWQFPQGGIASHETAEQAMYRELYEEIGLTPQQVELIGCTREWLHYDIPAPHRRAAAGRRFKGQKQLWFLLRMLGPDTDVRLDRAARPEFDSWKWVDYWRPLDQVIDFKREVYLQALAELEPLLFEKSRP